jgi:phosphatidylserine/phosphatidylglycerophosphate/cardiolipin synthase-like enzyme
MIQGPAVADVERVFVERWNDGIEYHQPAYYYRYYSPNEHPSRIPLGPRLNEPSYSLNSVGSHSVQVLLTYGRTSSCQGYSWSPAGEFTIWASYLNAIQKAERYIYIEDQYFLPFGWLPPCFRRSGIAQESDIVFQLGEAIKRGVKVVVLVPAETEDISKIYQIYQRNLGCSYLNEIANNSEGEFIIASPYTPEGVPIYVHSKLMICDDELVLIGSANICQRSMTHDSELHIAIVDEEGKFARDLRRNLWSEHLGYLSSQSDLDDPDTAIEIFKEEMENPDNPKIRPYQFQQEDEPPIAYRKLMEIIDPYGGPPRFT